MKLLRRVFHKKTVSASHIAIESHNSIVIKSQSTAKPVSKAIECASEFPKLKPHSMPAFEATYDDIVGEDSKYGDEISTDIDAIAEALDMDDMNIDDDTPHSALCQLTYSDVSDDIDNEVSTPIAKNISNSPIAKNISNSPIAKVSQFVSALDFLRNGSDMACFCDATESELIKQWHKCKLSDDRERIEWRSNETLFKLSDVWNVKSCSDDALQLLLDNFGASHLTIDGLKSLAFTIEFRDYSFMTFVADSHTNAYLWFRAIQSLTNPRGFDAIQISDFLRIGSLSVMDFLSNPINNNQYFIDTVLKRLSGLRSDIYELTSFMDQYCISDSQFDTTLRSHNKVMLQRWDSILKYSRECEWMSESEITQFREQWHCLLCDVTAITIKMPQLHRSLSN